MQYLWIVITVIIFGLILKIVGWHGDPRFELGVNVNFDELKQRIRALSVEHKIIKSKNGSMDISVIASKISKAYKIISKKSAKGYNLLEFEKWLYDNNYFLEDILLDVSQKLQRMPKLPLINDRPRIYELINYIIRYSDGYLSKERIKELLNIYQAECPLSFDECRHIKTMIEYCLLEYAAIISLKSIVINKNILKACSKKYKHKINESLKNNSFIYGINLCKDSKKIDEIAKYCQKLGFDFSQRLDSFNRQIIRYNILISNVINSLRTINEIVNTSFILDISPINKILLNEEAGVYKRSTEYSKMLYLETLSRLARKKRLNELFLARHLITLINAKGSHIAHNLFERKYQKAKAILYIFSILFLAVGTNGLISYFFFNAIWKALIYFIISLPIYIFIFTALVNKLLCSLVRHKPLLRIDFLQGIPDEYLTMAVISQLISDKQELKNAIENLKKLKTVNNHKNIKFCLLLDFLTSNQEKSKQDDELLRYARKLFYEHLNENEYNIFWRKRTYNPNDNNYSGEERKRGAISKLISFLCGDDTLDSFCLVLGDTNQKIKYLIALDSDSFTLQCKEIIETMAHPQNHKYDLMGFAVHSNPLTSIKTPFSYAFSDNRGYDVYSFGCTNLGSDAFNQGLFCGKGIIDVERFNQKLKGKLPKNRILSHDLIEGAWLNTIDSDAVLYENTPADIKTHLNRSMRWTRGDWQNIGYLKNKVKDEFNRTIKNPINLLSKWRIFSNVNYSLVYICALFLLLISAFIGNVSLITFGLFLSFDFILILYSLLFNSFKSRFTYAFLREAKEAFLRAVIFAVCLPYIAINLLVAILQSLYRMIISKRNLLKWNTYAHSSLDKKDTMSFWAKELILPCLITFWIYAAFSFLMSGINGILNSLWALIFLFSIPVAYFSSYRVNKPTLIQDDDKALLFDIAKRTYEYFVDFGLKSDNQLICDNYQENYIQSSAKRTSPTNIGYQILSAICAYDLKIIDYFEMYNTLSNIIGVVSKLKKWRGNLYNWYDTQDLKVIRNYISTVDNGNLLAALIVAKQTLKKKDVLYIKIKRLIDKMDLSKLYDYNKKLFYLGTDTRTYDKIHYDLMASEAMLTSFLAVCLNKVPKEHWHHLSRTSVRYDGNTLFSWSGGMFEYLMPFLFLKAREGSMLYQSSINCVNSQIRYTKQLGYNIWGISESQYFATDNLKNYQYKAFGVPYIALKNSDDNLVISPYSTGLALEINPKQAIKNIHKLISYGLMGKYGLYEAMDLTEDEHINKTYMAHHQGMILCAIDNLLNNDIIRQRFMSVPEIQAFEIMLFEPEIDYARRKKIYKPMPVFGLDPITETITHQPTLPAYNLLNNGRYYLALDSQGNGCAVLNGITLNKENNYNQGVNVYINGKVIRLMSQAQTIIQNSSYCLYKYEYNDLVFELKIALMQDYDGEIRCLKITNDSENEISLRAAFFVEPVLTFAQNYYAHPVFNNMVVVTKKLGDNIIYAYRNNDKHPVYFAASLAEGKTLYESNRFNFHTRNGLGWIYLNQEKADSFGEILEPVLGAIQNIKIPPMKKATINYILVAGSNLDIIKDAICAYSTEEGIEKAIDTSTIYLKQMWKTFSPEKNLMCTVKTMFARLKTCAINYEYDYSDLHDDIRTLLKNGINAVNPIISFFYRSENTNDLLKTVEIFKYLSAFGLKITLVLLYSEPEMYINPMLSEINRAIDRLSLRQMVSEGRINIINITRIDENIVNILKRVSQYYFDGVFKSDTNASVYPSKLKKKDKLYPTKPIKNKNLNFELGMGGFIDQTAYYVNLTKDNTPLPWSNIIAVNGFGTLITEKGGGYTWSDNSRESKLTVWQNDVIFDRNSEEIIIRDENTKISWKATKDNLEQAHYTVIHDLGETVFETSYNGIYSKTSEFIDIDAKAKIFNISLSNTSQADRKISIALNLELALGVNSYENGDKLFFKKENAKILAYNAINNLKAYLGTDQKEFDYLFSSMDFDYWCSGGEWINLSCSRPCLALKVETELKSDQTKEINFWLSDKNYELKDVKSIRKKCLDYFKNLTCIKVSTPSEEINRLLSRLPYQVLCSRFFGRCGYYQAGGAYGFRDQLQDCLTVLYINSDLVREHIIRCASHQYEEGDVQHWWHPQRKGTRTFMTDDLLFLPLLVAEYIKYTGDFDILDEKVPYLRSPALKPGEHSRYEEPEISHISDTVYMHCIRAFETAILRRSHRGLSLIGSGDWNDAMDKVGPKGEGESIWLSMFLCYCLNEFLPLVRSAALISEYKNEIIELKKAVREYGWDGEWYRRAYFDNGYPLGSIDSKECKIDILSQAWAVISNIGDDIRAKKALSSAEERLVDYEYKIVKLMDPPIKELDAGYISNYPKGVRENGGQYTHAAVWFAQALILNGQKDKGYKILDLINPMTHTMTFDDVQRYKGEPYVMAADVYSNPLFLGRAGWTYYTGTASWMYKVLIENVLGIKRRGRKLLIEPSLPSSWKECEVIYNYDGSEIKIKIVNKGNNQPTLYIDDRIYYNINYLTLNHSLSRSKIVVEI